MPDMHETFTPSIQIYLMSYNRPEYIVSAIDSILNQNFKKFELIISDNSSTNEVNLLLKQKYPEQPFKYIRRQPSLSSAQHFLCVLSEVTANYFMIFHDDDIMLSNCVGSLINEAMLNPMATAISGNAHIIMDGVQCRRLFAPGLRRKMFFQKVEEMALCYLLPHIGVAPFPGYLYKRLTPNLLPNYKEGRKYSDASFIMNHIKFGPVIWLPEPIMLYRVHKNNDSRLIDIASMLSLLRYILRNASVKKNSSPILDYKFWLYFAWLLQSRAYWSENRQKIILKATIFFYLKNPYALLKRVYCKVKKFFETKV